MKLNNFRVDLNGVLEILSDHLYSSADVFVRELLQNAVDAIFARQQIGNLVYNFEPEIHFEYFDDHSLGSRRLMISDNGIGLTEEEMHQFLSVIGTSSKKMAAMRNSFIGQFGIGLLSCFMVSDEIVVVSKSIHSAITFEWCGKRNGTYTIKATTNRAEVGTSVFLTIKEEAYQTITHARIKELVVRYGKMLPISICYNYRNTSEILSQQQFPRIGANTSIQPEGRQDILAFGKKELGTIAIDGFYFTREKLKTSGVIFFTKAKHVASKVYVKNMFLSGAVNDIFENWAFFCTAVINSDTLNPTASREQIYHDENLEQLRQAFGKLIRKRLYFLADNAPKIMSELIIAHQNDMMREACQNEILFHVVFPHLKFETSIGRVSLKEFLKKSNNEIQYVSTSEEFRKILYLKSSIHRPVLNAGYGHAKTFIEKTQEVYAHIKIIEINAGDIVADTEQLNVIERGKMELVIENKDRLLSEYGGTIEVRKMDDYNIPVVYSNGDVMDRPLRRFQMENPYLKNIQLPFVNRPEKIPQINVFYNN